MADERLTDRDAITTPAVGDLQHIVDISDTTDNAAGTSKKTTLQKIADLFKDLTQTLTNKTLTSPVLTTPKVDTINEETAAAGVTADGTKLKDGNVELGTDGNIKEGTATPYKTISLDARAWQPTTTSGCASVATQEEAGQDIDYDYLAFDKDTDENAFVNIWMPGNWDAGVIQFRYLWTTEAGGAAETVTFELAGGSFTDDDAIDQANGTAVEIADTWTADGDSQYSAWSGDVTIARAAAGEWVHFELMRDVSEDDLGGDVRLIGVQIRYKEGSYNHF
tara:strand:- start:38 stop:874 length:837 start_codon:yes stop_codon:yes gene_type:complete